MNDRMKMQWAIKWALPLLASLLVGGLLCGALFWAAVRADDVAVARQKELLELIVSNMRGALAHDQESATVWDDAVRKTMARDTEWLKLNLGQWMHTYFGHDVAIILSADGQPVYSYPELSGHPDNAEDLRRAYQPLTVLLHKRLAAGDTEGVTNRVLSIGEGDIAMVGSRPAVISVKPIISDSGNIPQQPGREFLHVALRYLDGSLPEEIARDYQFDRMQFSPRLPQDQNLSSVPLISKSGATIGYFAWSPFKPGASVMRATLPAIAALVAIVFLSASLGGRALLRRSAKLRASRKELQHLALHDVLTGLANRAHFNAELAATLTAAAPRERNGVLFVDLDRFKAVNDTFGHPTGDKLIMLVAQRMRDILPDALIGRMGGDEFTLLLKGKGEEQVAAASDQIVRALREPFDIEGAHVMIGASVGAVVTNGPAEALEVTRQADIALYHAKASGRNTYAIFGSHMDDLLRNRRGLEQDLRAALESGSQIETFYQPVYSADDHGISSLEALARWKHPEKGFIPPDIFIPVAEEMGLIHEIGAIVLNNACSLLSELPSITIAVNASPLELNAADYALRVLAALSKWNIEPRRLEIEITESLALSGGGQSERTIDLLRKAGVRFAIDDFGTGYSSFSRMSSVCVDRIKIDRSFIETMPEADSRALVEAMISMAHARGLKITAEGVETDAQSGALKLLGCDNLQGFLFSQPLPRKALMALVRGTVSEAGAA